MGFPDNLLTQDETVTLHTHPHWKELILPAIGLVVFVVIGILAFFAVPDSWDSFGGIAQIAIVAIVVFLILWLVVAPWVSWSTTHYVITTRRVLLRSGVITRKGRDIPHSRINDVSFEQSVVQRMMGFGTLIVQSASEDGAANLRDMPKVEEAQSLLYRLVEQDRERRAGRQAESDPGDPGM